MVPVKIILNLPKFDQLSPGTFADYFTTGCKTEVSFSSYDHISA